MSHSSRKTSLSERRSPVLAAVLAALPGVVAIGFLALAGRADGFSVIYGGIGMLYVGRWMYASLALLTFDVLALLATALCPPAWAAVVLLRVLFQLVGMPIWATRATGEFNQLANAMEAQTAAGVGRE